MVSVDAYDLARLGIAYVVHRYPDLRLVGAASTADEAIDVVARARPDVVTISDTLPRAWDGLGTRLRRQHPHLGVVAVAHHADDTEFAMADQAGMSAYLSRHAPATALIAAIRHAGTAPGTFATFGVPWRVQQQVRHAPTLSGREQQVLDLLGEGLSTEQIAAQLHIRAGTVRTYVGRLYHKLEVANRYQALVAAAAGRATITGGPAAQPARTPAA